MRNLTLLLFFIPYILFSQHKYSGVIKNAITKEPLSYTNIYTNEGNLFYSNIKGQFEIQSKNILKTINVSYVGYQSKSVTLEVGKNYIEILLDPKTESLNEVVIQASENESLRIIKNVILKEPINNVLKNLSSYSYHAYNKTIIGANPDSISSKIDTLYKYENGKRVLKKIDSTNFKFKNTLEKRHLYLSENISKFQYKKGSEVKEEVLATRMAGFKQPFYEMLSLNFSNFNIYDDYFILAGSKYINPITNDGLKEYRYKIIDTLNTNTFNSFVIHFKPKKDKENAGLEGLLFIETNRFTITKAILELKGLIYVKLTQEFEYDNQINNWFELQKELIISKGDSDKNVSLFGGMVKFQKNNDSIKSNRKTPSDFVKFISKTVNSSIVFNELQPNSGFAEKIKVTNIAHKQAETFWNQYRTDSISKRDIKTYEIIDSLALKNKVEYKLELARALLKGYYPTKYFNIELSKIIALNQYEGLRLGIGGETNKNITEDFKLEGYLAYGTKDNDLKYHYGFSTRLSKYHNSWVGLNYSNDLKEAAALDFMLENNGFSLINPRNLNISDFYKYDTYALNLSYDIKSNFESKFKLSTGNYETVFDYAFENNNNLYNSYKLTLLSAGFLYSPFSEYMRTPEGKRKISNGNTDFLFQATQSFDGFLDGAFNFTQFIFRANHRIPFYKDNYLYLLIQGGLVNGDAPLTHLFNSTPNYTLKHPWIKRVTFGGRNSFETMQYNEFLSDKYVMFQAHQHLRKLNLGSFKPQITLITRAAFGNLSNKERHQLIQFKTMEKGYFESGLELNNLFKGFGASAFYRYGPYQYQNVSNNIAVKVTYKLSLGL